MGLEPGTTRQQVYDCIANWHKGDNKLLELSKAYKLLMLKVLILNYVLWARMARKRKCGVICEI